MLRTSHRVPALSWLSGSHQTHSSTSKPEKWISSPMSRLPPPLQACHFSTCNTSQIYSVLCLCCPFRPAGHACLPPPILLTEATTVSKTKIWPNQFPAESLSHPSMTSSATSHHTSVPHAPVAPVGGETCNSPLLPRPL